ncbi:MAG: MerR family transcriptional regulator [Nocardia sp.]|uniref:MerR family transcriptional regulator n=1 Tax=Nocardia sp. TaxID=1821 RepID=UPI00260EF44A|nr:helix-turn-helix domain-containing protein [Nocardia sp.]MCU1646895.1 MerR family transcriptional regulator [Nocardia sp.]
MDLLSIGAFARLAHLSPKALRLYDELRLLPPVRVDPDSGYRWYSPDQLEKARRVSLLRQLDMPLARIREVLELSPDAAAAELATYWSQQEQAVAAKRQLVGFLIDQLTGRKSVMHEVLIREMPARTLLSTTENLTADQIPEFATRLFPIFGGPGVPRPEGIVGVPFLRYRGEVTADSDGPVEFCCPVIESDAEEVIGRFPAMTSVDDPAGREIYIRIVKADMMTALGFESLHQWLLGHHEQADWTPRQIFLRDPSTAGETDPIYELAVRLR